MTDIHHETIQLTHRYSASAERIYAAYLDPKAREIWSAPNETSAVEIVSADVRSGGVEETRCGAKGNLEYRTEVRYNLVLENELITFSETLFHGENLLMVALITFEFRSVNERVTELVLTDQITSFVGRDGVEGHRVGFFSGFGKLTRDRRELALAFLADKQPLTLISRIWRVYYFGRLLPLS